MISRGPRRVGAACAAAWCLFTSAPARASGPAAAEAVEICASASEQGQSLRSEGKLVAARDKLLGCARPSCPAVVRRDCDEQLAQVERAIPTVVLKVKDEAGRDVTDARVVLDGSVLNLALAGRAVAIDPGEHTLRLERAGKQLARAQLVAREGEKDRIVAVQLRDEGGRSASSRPGRSEGPPWAAYAAAGVSAVSLGLFASLAAGGQSDFDRCRDAGCTQGDRDSLEARRWVAFSALGVGAAAAVAAVWLFTRTGRSDLGTTSVSRRDALWAF